MGLNIEYAPTEDPFVHQAHGNLRITADFLINEKGLIPDHYIEDNITLRA